MEPPHGRAPTEHRGARQAKGSACVLDMVDGVDAPCSAASQCHSVAGVEPSHVGEEASVEEITTIGLDLAKNVFQVHGIDAAGKIVVRRKLRRGEVLQFFASSPPSLVGKEACCSA